MNNNLDLRNSILGIINGYEHAKSFEKPGKSNSVKIYFDSIVNILSNSKALFNSTHLHIDWSVGKGGWANVPWIAIFDNRETFTTQSGVYCTYLFCQDMSGVYLALSQGISKIANSSKDTKGISKLMQKNTVVRKSFENNEIKGFNAEHKIDLKATSELARLYEYSTIYNKYYPSESLPNNSILISDFNILIQSYQKYVEMPN